MKVAILANSSPGHIKPMAEGLHRMLSRIGVDSTVLFDGLDELGQLTDAFGPYIRANGTDTRSVVRRIVAYAVRDAPRTRRFIERLRPFTVVVVVQTVPQAFRTAFFNDRMVRALLPDTPIVLYDVFYLPTRGPWGRWLKEGKPDRGIPVGGNWGLERYDWYLCASVVSEVPMPRGPQPVSIIGLDLDDGTLYPEQNNEFVALLDFEHPPDMLERAVQIEACEETRTKYAVLNGNYSISAIRRIYRRTSAYFVAMRESFGLPICELQLCGSYVVTPYSNWCPSHWRKPDVYAEGAGELSPNFIVYQNDKNCLVRELQRLKANHDPGAVIANFRRYHPQFAAGNEEQLEDFVRKVRDGAITSQSHREYAGIVGQGDCSPFEIASPLVDTGMSQIVR